MYRPKDIHIDADWLLHIASFFLQKNPDLLLRNSPVPYYQKCGFRD